MDIKKLAQEKILILDGAMGTMIQAENLTEKDFRGEKFATHCRDLKGNNDILNLTKPDIIKKIHREYLAADADIIETNSFNSNTFSQHDYLLEEFVYELNFAAARIAKEVTTEFSTPEKPRFVAGVLGPTGKTLSISPDVNNPSIRSVSWKEMVESYEIATQGLLDGGADIIMIETIFDTLNAKAALFAVENIFEKSAKTLPIIISGTITDASGRILSGQTAEAFFYSLNHSENIISFGFNCALGAKELRPHILKLGEISETLINAHPNAGLPNEFGQYDQSPEIMAKLIADWAENGLINIIGGCCGTTPEHIKAIADAVKKFRPRQIKEVIKKTHLAGLEVLTIDENSNFINVGERTNVAGSRKFLRLIKDGKFEEALNIAAEQVENGANIIDINMDDAMLDAREMMNLFLNFVASEPGISKVPIMVDSSRWEVLENGLQHLQGKGIVNSISLKEGEDEFIKKAKLIRKYGAAVLVMAFDKNGQAETVERRVEICQKSYKILTEKVKFPPEDIIFDPNIFAIATGISAHNCYAKDYIEAVKIIKKVCPFALISGGVSNISFSFRGNDAMREAIHAVFLYHAKSAGMDMGIVNPAQLTIYDKIDKSILPIFNDAILNPSDEISEKLLEVASNLQGQEKSITDTKKWRQESAENRLKYALVNGIVEFIDADLTEILPDYADLVEIIEKPLMQAMEEVGKLFGAGKMFLPQVVKSARVMKKAVAFLMPLIEKNKKNGVKKSNGKIVLATVKGDVHDIGKNIVGIILECNNYEINDLGVMVPNEQILDFAEKIEADVVCVSGLITPSLEEMEKLAKEMKNRQMTIPLIVGGATTSEIHTAVKIAPNYDNLVVHGGDASQTVSMLNEILNSNLLIRKKFSEKICEKYKNLRENHQLRHRKDELPVEEARKFALKIDWENEKIFSPQILGTNTFKNITVAEIEPFINWHFFFYGWDLRGKFPEILEKNPVAKSLFEDAKTMLKKITKRLKLSAVCGIFPVEKNNEAIIIGNQVWQTPRQTKKNADGNCLALADFVAPKNDFVGLFAVSAGKEIDEISKEFSAQGDDFSAVLVKSLGDRLAEALAEWLHFQVRTKIWGYEKNEKFDAEKLFRNKFVGIRPAPGYPSCPNHADKLVIWNLLNVEKNCKVSLTETYMMVPSSSVCGFYFANQNATYFSL